MDKLAFAGGADVSTAVTCVIYGLGIIVSLGIYGVIQERVMSIPYEGEMFKVSVFLVLCNRLWAILYAVVMAYSKGEDFAAKAPLWKYLAIALSNVAATTCQYEALKWVSFPVQMLGKSFKMMPVMVWGILISGKSYKAKDWAIAGAVTGGVTVFLMTGPTSSKHSDKSDSIYGLLLLLGFLGFDGFTSTFQEKLFSEHKTSKYNQMIYVNSGSAVVSGSSLLISGNLPTAISFCSRHPLFFTHAMSLSAAAVSGQYFIYSQVKEFGALVFAITMNVRQVISILVSYLMYGHVITLLQFVGLVFVFLALFYKSFSGESKKDKPQKLPQAEGAAGGAPRPETVGHNDIEMSKQAGSAERVGPGEETR
eukprot:TRINITY_DN112531_c0_g1_i1.p1 TRINITY_DN112531_c0_g1~~TRINITY_DN112531_c0_g1_i1.p1  ORF type:complete len:387 (+),score=82.62 TRINITY_DN112531_c0_g1_i1:66-1163(+)